MSQYFFWFLKHLLIKITIFLVFKKVLGFFIVPKGKLTHLIFTFFIFDPLEDVVDDATSGGVAEKSVSVVDDETAEKCSS